VRGSTAFCGPVQVVAGGGGGEGGEGQGAEKAEFNSVPIVLVATQRLFQVSAGRDILPARPRT
jgi:hypothetical protein